MSYITKADIKEYLNLTTTDNDDLIDKLIAENISYIEGYCRQTFEAQDITKYFYGDSPNVFGNKYRFNYTKVNSITSLKYKEELSDDFTELTDIYLVNNYLINLDGFSDNTYYELIFNAGYSTVPKVINKVLKEMVSVSFLNSSVSGGDDRLGVSSHAGNYNGSSVTTNYKDMLTEWDKELYTFRIIL